MVRSVLDSFEICKTRGFVNDKQSQGKENKDKHCKSKVTQKCLQTGFLASGFWFLVSEMYYKLAGSSHSDN